MIQFIEAALQTNRVMERDEKEVVTKRLKCVTKQKGRKKAKLWTIDLMQHELIKAEPVIEISILES